MRQPPRIVPKVNNKIFSKTETLILQTENITCKIVISEDNTIKDKKARMTGPDGTIATIDMGEEYIDVKTKITLHLTDNKDTIFSIDLSINEWSEMLGLMNKTLQNRGIY